MPFVNHSELIEGWALSEEYVTTKAELLAHIARDWAALQTLLNGLSAAQWTQLRNPDGWAVKDHIAHLAAWQRSVIAFLQGQPRHEALDVPQEIYLSYDEDAINAVIFAAHRDDSLEAVRADLAASHEEILRLLAPLSDEDLHQRYSHFLPAEEPQGGGSPAFNVIYGNTAHHYRTHQVWIEAQLRGQG